MESNRVLIVDDDALQRSLLQSLLIHLGFHVTCCQSGLECLERLKTPDCVDIILLDRRMEGMDGLDVLRCIKSDPKVANLPVIMLTGEDHPDEVSRGINAGAFYYIVKPPAIQPLQAILNSARRHVSRVRAMQKLWENNSRFIPLVESCQLHLRTLVEAEAAAVFISQFFPQPLRALTGVSELLVNAIEHGNLGIQSQEKQELLQQGNWMSEIERRLQMPQFRERLVRINLRRAPNRIEIEIQDEGQGFHHENDNTANLAQGNSGRGIALARLHSFDGLKYLEQGNKVLAWKNLEINN